MSRSRRAIVAFALIASLLVVTAPAAASHQLVVASAHTTDTDFNAGTLTNMTVVGSGTGTTVRLQSGNSTFEDFEDDAEGDYTGETGSFSIQSTTVHDGSFAAQVDYDGLNGAVVHNDSPLPGEPPGPGENFQFWIRAETDNAVHATFGGSGDFDSNTYYVALLPGSDEMQMGERSGGSTEQSNTTSTSPTGPDTWYRFVIYWRTDNATAIRAELFDGSGTSLGNATITDTSLGAGGLGFRVGGPSGHSGYYDTYNITGAGRAPGTYISQNHTAEDTEQGTVDITEITNATATVTWETSDGGPWHTLNRTTGITSVANHTFTWSKEPNSTVRVNVTVLNQTGNGAPSFTMADETVLFRANRTGVDNSSATPTGGLSTLTPTIEIDLNDSDFPLAQGDAADAELFVDDASRGTDTLTANGTASISLTGGLSGGSHDYYWVVNDSYGHSTTSQTFTVSTPANITIRNVTEPHGIIKSCTAEILVSGNESTVDIQEVSDGNISMTGLPLDESYVIIVDCDNYHQRAIPVEDVFEQADVFLLNTSVASIENTFDVQDNTGSFPEPLFLIQRPINRSLYDSTAAAEYQWTTVGGDRISAAGTYVIDLEQDARYRLQVKDDGNVRVLGEYTAVNAGTITITIGQVTWPVQQGSARAFFTSKTIEDSGDWTVEVFYRDQANVTDQLDVTVHERGNASNVLFTDSQSGPVVTYKATFTIPSDDTDTTWNVSYDADLSSGSSAGNEMLAGATRIVPPLDQNWLMAIFAAFIGVFAALSGSRDAGLFAVLVVVLVGIAMAFQVVLINVAFYTVAVLIALGGAARGWVNYP